MALTLDRIDALEQDLKSRAFLYDDPTTFRAAIGLAMSMVREDSRHREEEEESPERGIRRRSRPSPGL